EGVRGRRHKCRKIKPLNGYRIGPPLATRRAESKRLSGQNAPPNSRPEWKDRPMLSNSVNTNVGAMIALQNLNATNVELATAQNRINTGKKVATAKDNGAIWAIAQAQRSDVVALGVVRQSLDRGVAAVDVAISA